MLACTGVSGAARRQETCWPVSVHSISWLCVLSAPAGPIKRQAFPVGSDSEPFSPLNDLKQHEDRKPDRISTNSVTVDASI